MGSVPTFYSMSASSNSVYNGAVATYSITIASSIDMLTGDILFFTFPPETQVLSTAACAPVSPSSVTAVVCSILAANKIQAVLTLSSTVLALTQITFTVSNVVNPPSTYPSSTFSLFYA